MARRLWIRSSLAVSSMECNAQIWVAYPKCILGRTKPKNSVCLTVVPRMNLVFPLTYPSSFLAHADCSYTCLLHVRSSVIHTPRSFSVAHVPSRVLLSLLGRHYGLVMRWVSSLPRSIWREKAKVPNLSEYFCVIGEHEHSAARNNIGNSLFPAPR